MSNASLHDIMGMHNVPLDEAAERVFHTIEEHESEGGFNATWTEILYTACFAMPGDSRTEIRYLVTKCYRHAAAALQSETPSWIREWQS